MSLIQTPWTSQPQQAVGIDASNGLRTDFAVTPVSNVRGVLSSATAVMSSSQGNAFVFPNSLNTTSQIDFGNSAQDIAYLSPGWMMYVFNPGESTNWSGSGTYIANKSDNNSSKGWTLFHLNGTITFRLINSSGNKSVVSNNVLKSGKWHVLIIDYGGSPYAADGSSIWVDGVNVTSSSGTGGSGHNSDASQSLRIGNGYYGAAYTSVGAFALAAFGRKRLSGTEIRSLSQNPWQIFRPLPRRIFVPVAAGSSDTLLYPATADLILGGKTPTLTQPNSASPSTGVPRLTGYTPTISQSAGQVINPAKASATLTGKLPTFTQPNAISPTNGAPRVTGYAPTLNQSANQTLSPSKVSLIFSGKTPTIDQTAANSILPATGHAYTTGQQPSLAQNQSISPAKGSISVAGKTPVVQQSVSINPLTGAVVVTGKTPTLTQNQTISPAMAHAILTGKTPTISDTTPLTDSEKLDLILDILSNRQTLDPVTGLYTLYQDDGVTVLKTALAWEDAAGTQPYRGQALQRLDPLS